MWNDYKQKKPFIVYAWEEHILEWQWFVACSGEYLDHLP